MTQTAITETELRLRKDFSKIPPILEIPDLIEIQKQTFERFNWRLVVLAFLKRAFVHPVND